MRCCAKRQLFPLRRSSMSGRTASGPMASAKSGDRARAVKHRFGSPHHRVADSPAGHAGRCPQVKPLYLHRQRPVATSGSGNGSVPSILISCGWLTSSIWHAGPLCAYPFGIAILPGRLSAGAVDVDQFTQRHYDYHESKIRFPGHIDQEPQHCLGILC